MASSGRWTVDAVNGACFCLVFRFFHSATLAIHWPNLLKNIISSFLCINREMRQTRFVNFQSVFGCLPCARTRLFILHILLNINLNMQKSIINIFRFDGDNILSRSLARSFVFCLSFAVWRFLAESRLKRNIFLTLRGLLTTMTTTPNFISRCCSNSKSLETGKFMIHIRRIVLCRSLHSPVARRHSPTFDVDANLPYFLVFGVLA